MKPETKNWAVDLEEDGVRYSLWLPQQETDYIQKHVVKEQRPYEVGMLQDMRSRLSPGDHVLDIGANIGNHTIYLCATADCRVTAFEPNTELSATLRRSVSLNGLGEKIRIVEAGAGARPGTAHFASAKPENLGAQSLSVTDDPSNEIKIVTLDDTDGLDDVRMIKIDVEGMELQVLEGSLKLLERARPIIYVEALNEELFLALDRCLSALGYSFWDTFNKDATHLFIHASELEATPRDIQMHKHMARTQYYRQAAMEGVIPRLHDLVERLDVSWNRFHQVSDQARGLQEIIGAKDIEILGLREQLNNKETALQSRNDELGQAKSRFIALKDDEIQSRNDELGQAKYRLIALEERLIKQSRVSELKLEQTQSRLSASEANLTRVRAQLTRRDAELQSKNNELDVERAKGRMRTQRSANLGRDLAEAVLQLDASAEGKPRWVVPVSRLLRQSLSNSKARLADTCIALAKDRYASDDNARLFLASHASTLDPKPYREKWYAFRLYECGLIDRAEEVLDKLAGRTTFSDSEQRVLNELKERQTASLSSGGPTPANRTTTFRKSTRGKKKLPRDMNVALLCDEFTYISFRDEFNAIVLNPDDWRQKLEENEIDLFFCESAWSGVDSVRRPWKGKIYASQNFTRENRGELLAILETCRKSGVPTIFWNKEDPGHYGDRVHDFAKTAQLFDFVFTTAEECVDKYKADYGCQNVAVLPFAAQPRLYNPIELHPRIRRVTFAGSWYAYFEERCADMHSLFKSIADSDVELEIYDRYYEDSDPNHIFPEEYRGLIRPSVQADKVPDVFKSSLFGLNVNSVKESPTMFARRVFELMASNTLVISNYSSGMKEMFGDSVVFADREPHRLRELSDTDINRMRDEALHLVLAQHTYERRFESILDVMQIPYIAEATTVTLVHSVGSREQALAAIRSSQFAKQEIPGAQVLLLVSSAVPSIEVPPFYEEFNRFDVGVSSEEYLLKYAPTQQQVVETEYFALVSGGTDFVPKDLRKALLHRQYLNDEIIQYGTGLKYVFGPSSGRYNLVGPGTRFLSTIRNLNRGAVDGVYHV